MKQFNMHVMRIPGREERSRKKKERKNGQMIARNMGVWGKWKHKAISFLYTIRSNLILAKYIEKS